jgi:hypothetical protein
MVERCPPVPMFYFTNVKNVGDQVNPWLVSRLFGSQPVLCTQDQEHVLAIGSLMGFANRRSRIWGSGVLHPSAVSEDIVPDQIYAVRGKLSYEAMRARGIAIKDIPLGDPGFLVGQLVKGWPRVQKKYRLGLAAHYVDRAHSWVQAVLSRPDVADLDVHADPEVFLARLAGCETVVSSSLHGLIFAEVLQVPNVWIELSDKVLGGGFKFRDWFSLAEVPQHEPEVPKSIDDMAGLIDQATLHGMRIDADGLIQSFRRLSSAVQMPA